MNKPKKKENTMLAYVLAFIGSIGSIVCWFLPTFELKYFSEYGAPIGVAEKIVCTYFSYNDVLPTEAAVINFLLLACSIVSLVIIGIALLKKKFLTPDPAMIFPAASYLLYLVMFFIRFINMEKKYSLYDLVISPIGVIHFLSIALAFSFSLSIVLVMGKLKKQQQETADSVG